MKQPLVSIVIPVYNGENYLAEAIESALAQTYGNIEILVVNDGSTDGGATAAVAARYARKIRYFEKENGGVSTALNTGIVNMRGKYFSWLSHDDLYDEEKIARQVESLEAADRPSVGYTDFLIFQDDIEKGTTYRVGEKPIRSPRCFLSLCIGNTVIHGCSMLIPKVCFDACGLFDPALKMTQDYDMWFRIGSAFPFVYTEGALVYSRSHAEQDSRAFPEAMLRNADEMYEGHIQKLTDEEVTTFFDCSWVPLVQHSVNAKLNGLPLASDAIRARAHVVLPWIVSDVSYAPGKMPRFLRNSIETTTHLLRTTSPKPRIAFLASSWMFGGVERGLSSFLPGLLDGYEVILITSQKDVRHFPLPEAVYHIEMENLWGENAADRIASLCYLTNTKVFVGCVNCSPVCADLYARLRMWAIKVIACNQESFFYPYLSPVSRYVVPMRINAMAMADVVTWLTAANARISTIYQGNSIVMPHPIPGDLLDARTSRCRTKTVLTVGRFVDGVKRLDRILRCFAEVRKRVPDARLVVVGAYDLDLYIPGDAKESLRDLMHTLSIPTESVDFVGGCPDTRVYYEKASVFVMTSVSEGQPMVLLEASAHGLPSVAQDIPGLDDIIADGESGYIVPQDDAVAMGARVASLLEDLEACRAMGARAKERIEKYSAKDIDTRWKKLLSIVLETNQDVLHNTLIEEFPETSPIDDVLVKQTYDIMKRVGYEFQM